VLDDVERRRFAIDPARKDSPPLTVASLDVELEESSGQLLLLPRGGPLAGAKPHDRILEADRLSGPHRQVADDPVALVQKADDRDPFCHRSDPRLVGSLDRRLGAGRRLLALAAFLAAARAKQGRHDERTNRRLSHLYSGVQGL
jgi:hypothetical protein